MVKKNIFDEAISRLNEASKYVQVSPNTLLRLQLPERVLYVTIPVQMDDGSIKVFEGYRSQHNTARGPAKGGIRFHPEVSLDEVRALSFWMTCKCAATGLPYGGGKGGIICNPKELSTAELERLSRGYVRQLADFIGPDIDIPAPDVYTTPQIMGWMLDEYSVIHRKKSYAVITGKPIALGGSLGRGSSTGRGGYYCIKLLEKHLGFQAQKDTVSIQGFGNAAQSVAMLLFQDGYKILAVTDSKGGIFKKEGLDIPKMIDWKERGHSLHEMAKKDPSLKVITNEELFATPVTIFIPAALENAITKENAGKIQARAIVELANGPLTSEADDILNKNDVLVVPDILANSGGVIVSYFEWVQNRQGYYWTEADVNNRLQEKITAEFEEVYAFKQINKIDMRKATYAHALKRLDAAMNYT